MTDPDGPPAVNVGVMLPRQPDDLGDWLADGTAFEAAGAHALWVDLAASPELEPAALTAALAAVTYRSLLVVAMPAADEPLPGYASTLATVARLSRGRLRILAHTAGTVDLDAAREAVPVVQRIAGSPAAFEHKRDTGAVERWVAVPAPDGRASWRAALHEAAERGDTGLVVPADPRLLDILRNPDEPGGRLDLQLAQG